MPPEKLFRDSKSQICLPGKLSTVKTQLLEETRKNRPKTEDARSKFVFGRYEKYKILYKLFVIEAKNALLAYFSL